MTTQNRGHLLEDARPFERDHVTPFEEPLTCLGDDGVGVIRTGIGDRGEYFAGRGVERIGILTGFRHVPLPAHIDIQMLGHDAQHVHLGHDVPPPLRATARTDTTAPALVRGTVRC